MIKVKNHQMPATMRVDRALKGKGNWVVKQTKYNSIRERVTYLGRKSQPCCISDPIANHMQFSKVN